jgi:hypothetical protein
MGFWPSIAVFVVAYFVIVLLIALTTGVRVGLFVGIAGASLVTWYVRRRMR